MACCTGILPYVLDIIVIYASCARVHPTSYTHTKHTSRACLSAGASRACVCVFGARKYIICVLGKLAAHARRRAPRVSWESGQRTHGIALCVCV